MTDKEVLRKCIGCFELKNRQNLLKITKEAESGKIFINPNSKIFGRSVYLCYNKMCIIEALKKNKISKLLKVKIPEEIIQEIERIRETCT